MDNENEFEQVEQSTEDTTTEIKYTVTWNEPKEELLSRYKLGCLSKQNLVIAYIISQLHPSLTIKLNGEKEIARQLGVNRQTVAEAVKIARKNNLFGREGGLGDRNRKWFQAKNLQYKVGGKLITSDRYSSDTKVTNNKKGKQHKGIIEVVEEIG